MDRARDRSRQAQADAPQGKATGPSDDELLTGLLAGRSEDFDRLYDRMFPRIYAFVHARVRSHADAEEIVQETFIAVFKGIQGYRGTSSLLSWVYGVARNTLNNHIRKTVRRRERVAFEDGEQFEQEPSRDMPTPAEAFELGEYQRDVMAALGDVAAWQAEVFVMRHLENLSIAEITRRTGRTSDSVRSCLFRVKRIFLDHANAVADSTESQCRPRGAGA